MPTAVHDRAAEAVGDCAGRAPGGLREHDDELVTAETADDVVAARDAAQGVADRAQDEVPLEVTALVVDPLEAVEVDEAAAEPVALAAGSLDFVLERLGQPGVVEAPGERVDARRAQGRRQHRARVEAEAGDPRVGFRGARELAGVAFARLGELGVEHALCAGPVLERGRNGCRPRTARAGVDERAGGVEGAAGQRLAGPGERHLGALGRPVGEHPGPAWAPGDHRSTVGSDRVREAAQGHVDGLLASAPRRSAIPLSGALLSGLSCRDAHSSVAVRPVTSVQAVRAPCAYPEPTELRRLPVYRKQHRAAAR